MSTVFSVLALSKALNYDYVQLFVNEVGILQLRCAYNPNSLI